MISISELLKKTQEFFLNKEIPDSQYHAERLLAESMNTDRISIYLNLDKIADEQLISDYRTRIQDFINNSSRNILVSEQLNLLKNILIENEIPEAELHAGEIIAHVLQISRNELKTIDDRTLSTEELEFINLYKNRRLNREPMQYILGYTEFYGYPIRLNKNVLIPRPETEILVEKTLDKIAKETNLNVLDIGTGSGCIPIALKQECPGLSITSIDLSEQALLLAEKNAGKNDVEIKFIQMDFLNEENRSTLDKYDIIISNPPYVTKTELQTLARELAFEPQAALSDFADGLTFYQAIIKFAESHLNENGFLALEIGYNQANDIIKLLSKWQFKVIKDYNDLDRIIIASLNH